MSLLRSDGEPLTSRRMMVLVKSVPETASRAHGPCVATLGVPMCSPRRLIYIEVALEPGKLRQKAWESGTAASSVICEYLMPRGLSLAVRRRRFVDSIQSTRLGTQKPSMLASH